MTTPTPVGGYISLPVTVDPNALIRDAFAAIQAQIPGWTPREGHLEVAVIEEAAQMMAETAGVAAQVPIAIFAYFGSLVGVLPEQGAAATVPVQFTMTGTSGYTIPAGTLLLLTASDSSQVLFAVQTTITIPAGSATGAGTLVCQNVGTFPNGIAAGTCQLVASNASVSTVATTAAVSGGVDPETTDAYLSRLSAELQLLAPRPILPSDFAELATNVTGVYRALAINLLNAGRTFTDGSVVSGSAVLTSPADAAFTAADVGKTVTATGVPSGTTVQSYQSATSVTMSANATATGSGLTVTLGDLTNQERCVTVCGVDSSGDALSSTVQASLLSYLQSLREVNFIVQVVSPTYTAVDVAAQVVAMSGMDPATVAAAATANVKSFLNPANWGGGAQVPPTWESDATVVRYLDVAQVLRSTYGVAYVTSGFTIGVHGGTMGTSDVTLPGDAPLPTAGSGITITCVSG